MSSKYKQKQNIVFQEVDGEIKILDENQDAIVSLNGTASFIWSLLSIYRTKEDISNELMNEFDVEKEQSLKDVELFLKMLGDHDLLVKKK